jgi:transcriptional regulator with XRE-family HTH domain
MKRLSSVNVCPNVQTTQKQPETKMKTTLDYLNDAKAKLGFTSDNAFAGWLEVSPGGLSNYQSGRRIVDDYAAAKIAQALGIDPLEVIALANMEREKVSERKEFWRKIAKGGVAATIFLAAISGTYSGGIDENAVMNIMLNKECSRWYAIVSDSR